MATERIPNRNIHHAVHSPRVAPSRLRRRKAGAVVFVTAPPMDLLKHDAVRATGRVPSHYRADIDGIRALAVVAVVIYHAFPEVLRRGFLGVDIFFVISGFLITRIISEELHENRFSIGRFYARRVIRIFPALVVVSSCSLIGGWVLMLPIEFQQLGEHMIGSVLFLSNIQFWLETGYFDKAAELKPFLHLWSLGVEEQFYVIWPVLLMYAARANARPLKLVATITILSFLARALLVLQDPSAAFYWPFGRFWELMLGASIALGRNTGGSLHAVTYKYRAWKPLGPAFGLSLIIFSITAGDDTGRIPFWWELLPTVGTWMIIYFGGNGWISRAVLGNRGMVQIGRVSYPLYLWHWPLLSFLRIYCEGTPSVWSRIITIFFSLGLAYITYVAIERPIRFSRHRSAQVSLLCTSLVTLGLIGVVIHQNVGFPSRIPEPLRKYVSAKYDWAAGARVGQCWLSATEPFNGFLPACFENRRPGRNNVLIWGDSHAARLYVGVSTVYGKDLDIGQLTRDRCAPIKSVCVESNNYVLSLIEKNPPDLVIMFAVWNLYSSNYAAGDEARRIRDTIRTLKRSGVREVLVIGPAPQWTADLPRILTTVWRRDFPLHTLPVFIKSHLKKMPFEVDRQLEDIVSSEPAEYISLIKLLCNKGGCLTRINDNPEGLMTADYGHLTMAGAEFVARLLPIVAGRKPTVGSQPEHPD